MPEERPDAGPGIRPGPPPAVEGFWTRSVRGLFPGYFASVMATGIVSLALVLTGYRTFSDVLWGVGTGAYLLLLGAYGLRWRLAREAVVADLRDPARLFGYFTFVAGSGVLGSRFVVGGMPAAGWVLAAVAALTWLVLSYWAAYRLLDIREASASLRVNGTWLLLTVGAESVAVAGTLLAPAGGPAARILLFIAYAFWAVGLVFYLAVILAVMDRLFFTPVAPAEAGPPYWINMGALAISTLAGAHLVLAERLSPFLAGVRPFVTGVTVAVWAFGSWWIPFLVLMGLWRHGWRRVPLTYDPAFWSLVFPLGMYTAATFTLARLPGLHLLAGLVPWALAAAVAAWTATAAGYVTHSWYWLRAGSRGRRV